jgi:outer membrane protein, multidrug efflux system
VRMLLRSAAAVVLALGCGGCFLVGPDYVAPSAHDLGVPAAYTFAARVTRGEGDGGDVATWWQHLGDPTLTELVAAAVRASLDVESARATLLEARARRRLAAANLWPSVGVSASAQRTKGGSGDVGSGSQNLYEAGFDASWEPDVVGGQRRALEGAEADQEGSLEKLRAAQVSVAAEVARNYVDLRSYQGRVAIAQANLKSQSSTLELTQWRVEAGLASSLDAEQARTNVEQTKAAIPPLERATAEAENRLAVLTGVAPGALHDRLAEAAPIPHVPEPLTIGIPADVLRQRPDVVAAERTLAAETARVGEAMAARYPSLTLSGSLGVQALTLGALTSGASVAASAVGSIAQTIFDAGRIGAKIKTRGAVREQALVAYRSAVLAALEDVENALVAITTSHARAQALGDAAGSARNAALLARYRYTAGIIDFVTLLDAERTVLSIEENLNAAQADDTAAVIRLYKALGGGWSAGGDGVI